MDSFGIKDIFDIVIVALLLYYLYRLMKESGTINIFYGVLAFIMVWVVTSELLGMRLIGSILDKFMSIGLLVLVILFQNADKEVSCGARLAETAGASLASCFTITGLRPKKMRIDGLCRLCMHA